MSNSKEPRPKAPRLASFGRGPALTARALAATLKQVRDEGLPEAISASSKRRDDQRLLKDCVRGGSFGPLITEVELAAKEDVVRAQHPHARCGRSGQPHGPPREAGGVLVPGNRRGNHRIRCQSPAPLHGWRLSAGSPPPWPQSCDESHMAPCAWSCTRTPSGRLANPRA